MRGKHRARGIARTVTTATLAVVAAAATFVVGQTGASAANADANCAAAAVNLQAPTPVRLAFANPQVNPCATDSKTLVSAAATLIPAPLGIGATRVTVSGVTSRTFEGWTPGGYVTTASSDIARLTLTGPGITVVATGIHSDATVLNADGFLSSANSWIGTLRVNGVLIKVQKNTPLVVPVALRIALYLNYRTVGYGTAQALPIGVTFPDHRYTLSLSESYVAQSVGCSCT